MRLKSGYQWMVYKNGGYWPKDCLDASDRAVGYAKENSRKVIPFARHDHHPKLLLYEKAVSAAKNKGLLDLG